MSIHHLVSVKRWIPRPLWYCLSKMAISLSDCKEILGSWMHRWWWDHLGMNPLPPCKHPWEHCLPLQASMGTPPPLQVSLGALVSYHFQTDTTLFSTFSFVEPAHVEPTMGCPLLHGSLDHFSKREKWWQLTREKAYLISFKIKEIYPPCVVYTSFRVWRGEGKVDLKGSFASVVSYNTPQQTQCWDENLGLYSSMDFCMVTPS